MKSDADLWAALENADPASDVEIPEDELDIRFASLAERRDTMGTTFRHLERPTASPPPSRRRGAWAGALAFVLVLAAGGTAWMFFAGDPDDSTPPIATRVPTSVIQSEAPPADEVPATTAGKGGAGETAVGASLSLRAPWRRGEIFAPDPGMHVVETPAIATDGSRLVVVGSMRTDFNSEGYAAVWYSDDGVGWHRVEHDPAVFGATIGGWTAMKDVAHGRAGFVAVGRNERYEPVTWVSPDGVTWTRGDLLGDSMLHLDSVAATDEAVVAVGSQGTPPDVGAGPAVTILVSEDGRSWSRVAPPAGMHADPEYELRVTTTAGGFLLPANAAWQSVDGREWIRIADVPPNYLEGGIAAGSRGVVASSEYGRALSLLVDGARWATTPLGAGVDWEFDDAPFAEGVEPVVMDGVLAVDEGFIALGTDFSGWRSSTGGTVAVVYSSPDGTGWDRVEVEHFAGITNEHITDAVRFGDRLVGVGAAALTSTGVSGATWTSGGE